MSNEAPNDAFWERADAVINLANQQTESAQSEDVSGSLLYASARFNAFLIAAQASDVDALRMGKEDAVA